MIDDDEFEAAFEEFSELSDAQIDAVLEREMAEYCRLLDSLTPLERYRHHRRQAVEGCLTWRRAVKEFGLDGFFREHLRARQKRLLGLRIELATGMAPGRA